MDDERDNEDIIDLDVELDAIPEPPDGKWAEDLIGGYGWVVMFATMICNMIVDGITFNFGTFWNNPGFRDFFNASSAELNLIGAIQAGCYLLIGPVVGGFVNRFGCRPVLMAGGVMTTISFIIASFSSNLIMMILTYGFLAGCSFGFLYLPATIAVSIYFEKRRSFATGIAVCGSGLGIFAFSPLFNYLLEIYGWRNTVLIIAAITLHGVPCGLLVRPLESKAEILSKAKKHAQKTKRSRLASTCSEDPYSIKTNNEVLEKVQMARNIRIRTLQSDTTSSVVTPTHQAAKATVHRTMTPQTSNGSVANGSVKLRAIPHGKMNKVSGFDSNENIEHEANNQHSSKEENLLFSDSTLHMTNGSSHSKQDPTSKPNTVDKFAAVEPSTYDVDENNVDEDEFVCVISPTKKHGGNKSQFQFTSHNSATESDSESDDEIPEPLPPLRIEDDDEKEDPEIPHINNMVENQDQVEKEEQQVTNNEQKKPLLNEWQQSNVSNVSPNPSDFSDQQIKHRRYKKQFPPKPRTTSGDSHDRARHWKSHDHLWTRSRDALVNSAHSIIDKLGDEKLTKEDYVKRPLYRKDIFFSGSIYLPPAHEIPHEVGTHKDTISDAKMFVTSMISIPPSVPEEEVTPVCKFIPQSLRDGLRAMFDITLLKQPAYTLLLSANLFGMIGLYTPFFYLQRKAQFDLNIHSAKAALLLSVIGGTNTGGRVLAGFLANLPHVKAIWLNNASFLLVTILCLLFPFYNSFILLVVYAVFTGLSVGFYIMLTSIILCEMLGIDRLTAAFGLLTAVRGFASVIGPPITGAIFDSFGTLNAPFYFAGICFGIAGVLYSFIRLPCIVEKHALPSEPPEEDANLEGSNV